MSDIQIPIRLVGSIRDGDGADCKDGAMHLLDYFDDEAKEGETVRIFKTVRIVGTNSQASDDIVSYSNAKIFVAAFGYMRSGIKGPECDRFDAFSVTPAGLSDQTDLGSLLTHGETSLSDAAGAAFQELAGLRVDAKSVQAKSLYYICGVRGGKDADGHYAEAVVFPPEFLYVFDLGYPAKCGILCKWRNAGAGDPGFPDFTTAITRSIYSESSSGLIYPAVTGDLLVGTVPDCDEADLLTWLKSHASKVSKIATNTYALKVKPFHERSVARDLEAAKELIRYAEINSIVRLIDFGPGWRVTKLL